MRRYAGHLAGSVSEISESTSGFLRAQGSGSRLFALLDKEPKYVFSGTRTLPEGYKGEITFENVTFAYPDYPNSPVRYASFGCVNATLPPCATLHFFFGMFVFYTQTQSCGAR